MDLTSSFMSAGSPSDVKFEIGHVLFIDIVGYSKLLITEQSEQIQKLKEIVLGTEQFGDLGVVLEIGARGVTPRIAPASILLAEQTGE